MLPPSVCKGAVDTSTAVIVADPSAPMAAQSTALAPMATAQPTTVANSTEITKPHLNEILNLNDFEAVAKTVMRRDGWAYYSRSAVINRRRLIV